MSERNRRRIAIAVLIGCLMLNLGGAIRVAKTWSALETPDAVGGIVMIIGATILAWAADPRPPARYRRSTDSKEEQ